MKEGAGWSGAAVELPPLNGHEGPDRCFGDDSDPFELGERIGGGAQGTVFVCHWLSAGKEYAAKFCDLDRLPPHRREAQRRELVREIQIMEKLHHPRVVNLHAHFWTQGRVIIVMDLARGGDLCEKLQQEVKAKGSAFRGLGGAELGPKHITRQLLDGIGYMHHNGIIHRDLKAENILIHSSHQALGIELHEVKIADFGLSKLLVEEGGEQTPGGGGGDPRYAAPERFEHAWRRRSDFDERAADFWSVGVLLYYILCGYSPYENPRYVKGLDAILHSMSRIRNCETWQAVSEDGQQFVRGLLNMNPDERLGMEGSRSCLIQPWLTSESLANRSPQSQCGEVKSEVSDSDFGRQGVVVRVDGWIGSSVDQIKMHLLDTTLCYGGPGGKPVVPFYLRDNEIIVAVMQEVRDAYLGNALVMYTSEGQVLAFEGSGAKERSRFVAPSGSHIVGLQFERSQIAGILIEDIPDSGPGSVASISGRTASAVDQVEIRLRNGRIRHYGSEGGTKKGPWELGDREFILIVEQVRRDWFLGSAIIFYTSAGNIIKLSGMQSSISRHFAAPFGKQVCGLHFQGSRLSNVSLCPASGDRSPRSSSLGIVRANTMEDD